MDLQSSACLWNTHCSGYKNRNKKGYAIDFLAEIEVSTTVVERKIATG
jgi:hypothetical protein